LMAHNGYRKSLEQENAAKQRYEMDVCPGDSGTPLVNVAGQLIGITRARVPQEISRTVLGPKDIRGFLDGLITKLAGLDSRYA